MNCSQGGRAGCLARRTTLSLQPWATICNKLFICCFMYLKFWIIIYNLFRKRKILQPTDHLDPEITQNNIKFVFIDQRNRFLMPTDLTRKKHTCEKILSAFLLLPLNPYLLIITGNLAKHTQHIMFLFLQLIQDLQKSFHPTQLQTDLHEQQNQF